VVATIIGAALRVPHAGTWPLYGDEAATALASTAAFSWRDLRPLAFAFNHYVAIPLLGPSELALRLGPLLAGLAAVPLVGLGVRRWYGAEAGICSALVVALSPAFILHSQFARYYMQAALLSGLLVYALRCWADTRRPAWLAAALAAFVTGWFTVQSTSFVLPGFVLWALWNAADSGLVDLLRLMRRRPYHATAFAILGLGVSAWLLHRMLGAQGETLATTVRYYSVPQLTLSLANSLGPALAVTMLAGMWLCWSDAALAPRDRTFLPLVTLGTVATFGAAFPFLAIGPPHVLSAAGIPLAALAGSALGRLWRTTTPAVIGFALAVTVLLTNARQLVSIQVDSGRPDYRRAVALVRERAGKSAPIVFATSHAVANYYAPELQWRELLVEPDALTWLRDSARTQTAFAIVAETRRGPEVDEALFGLRDAPPACMLIGRFGRPGLDYSVAAVRVYECPPNGSRTE
jgi:hypothetical protein